MNFRSFILALALLGLTAGLWLSSKKEPSMTSQEFMASLFESMKAVDCPYDKAEKGCKTLVLTDEKEAMQCRKAAEGAYVCRFQKVQPEESQKSN